MDSGTTMTGPHAGHRVPPSATLCQEYTSRTFAENTAMDKEADVSRERDSQGPSLVRLRRFQGESHVLLLLLSRCTDPPPSASESFQRLT